MEAVNACYKLLYLLFSAYKSYSNMDTNKVSKPHGHLKDKEREGGWLDYLKIGSLL